VSTAYKNLERSYTRIAQPYGAERSSEMGAEAEAAIATIDRAAVDQYERVRRSGLVNMYGYYNVIDIAVRLGFDDLAALTLDGYQMLQSNFTALMKHYGVTQD